MLKAKKRVTRQPLVSVRRRAPGIRIVRIFARYTDGSGATRRELGTAALNLAAMEELVERLRSQLGAPRGGKVR